MGRDTKKHVHSIKQTILSKSTLFSSAQEDALVESLFASIGDGAIATDEFGKIMRINSAALKILGFHKVEMLGQWLPRIVVSVTENDEPVELIDRTITKAFLIGQSVAEKAYYLRKDGHKIPVSVNASPIILGGKPKGAIIIFRDITLEYEVDRMKSDFISLASHQLRTPLSSINMYAQMLYAGYMGELTEKQRAAIRTITDSAERMSQLINTLLNITRIENGTIIVGHKRIDMNALSEEIVDEMRVDAEAKLIKLTFHASQRPPMAQTDRIIMKEILSNLISNAIKYTPISGAVRVSLKILKHKIILSVADTGIGIPSFSKDSIFSKFFRAPNVMRGETTGTGLGLYLVKGMAEQLGAEVWFDSELGEGSTFYLSIPEIS